MSQDVHFINGDLLRLRREARGWVLNDMATRACMSVKQIRQLEEGGISSFYSEAVKLTAAKKVGALLGLSADEVFAQAVPATLVETTVQSEELISESTTDVVTTLAGAELPIAPAEASAHIAPTDVAPVVAPDATDESPNSKSALWLIALLLGIAFAVGAYLQPKEESVSEPAPPIQVLPAEVVDPASAASSADAPASTSVVAAVVASAAVPVSSAVRLVEPPASAVAVSRVASIPVNATPATSAASKAP